MKTAVISSLFLAGVALAVPSKRAGEPVTFTSLDATLSDYTGSVQVSFTDPNYDVSTFASLTWYESQLLLSLVKHCKPIPLGTALASLLRTPGPTTTTTFFPSPAVWITSMC